MAEDPKPTDTGEDPLWLEIQARYVAARDHASKWREQAKEEFQFYAGDQWDATDRQKMEDQQRPIVTFNRIMRLINAVKGHESNNRAEVRYIPRTMGDAKVNELLTSASTYFRDQCDAEFEESDAFNDMLVCGMGWTGDRLSDDKNPDFDLIEERVDPMEMLWDPASKKPNLADSRYLFRRKRYTEKECRAIWPNFDGPYSDAFDDEDDDGQPHERNPRQSYQGSIEGKQDVQPDVLVLEYQYKEREAYYVVQTAEGQTVEISTDQMDDGLKEKLNARKIPMVLKRRTVIRRCFVIGRKVVQGPDVVCPHEFTYHCITGFRDRERNHWFGIVRMLKDPQRWSNKWLAQIMYILNSNAKGGVMLEENAVLDKAAFEASWADSAAITWVPEGSLKEGRVQPKPPPLPFTGVEKLLEYANNSFTDVSGVNQELLGLADRDQPGVLEWQRKQSAVTLLAPLFDSLRRFRMMQGRCWLYMMQTYVSDGRIIRITQDDQQMGVPFGGGQEMQAQIIDPRWKMPETAEYDVVIDQASSAPNQKEQTWGVLRELLPAIKDMLSPPVMMWALKYSPLPDTALEDLKKVAAQEAQNPKPDPEMMKVQAQIQAKQAEMQLEMQKAQQDGELKRQQAELDGQIKMALAKQEMEIEAYKAQQKAQIEQQSAMVKMESDRQRMQFEGEMEDQRMQREAVRADDAHRRQMQRDDEMAQATATRENEASAAKIKRENRASRAKTKQSNAQA